MLRRSSDACSAVHAVLKTRRSLVFCFLKLVLPCHPETVHGRVLNRVDYFKEPIATVDSICAKSLGAGSDV